MKQYRTTKNMKSGERRAVGRGIFAYKPRDDGPVMYGVSYMEPDRGSNGKRVRIRKSIGPTKKLAEDALALVQADMVRGIYVSPDNEPEPCPTLTEFSERYLKYAREHKRSWKRDAGVLTKLNEYFGSIRLDQLTGWSVEEYKAHSSKTVTHSTVNRELAVLKTMLTLARKWGVIAENPAADVSLYRETQRTFETLSEADEPALLEACAPHLRPLVVVALNTGMRRGELLALKWEHVDLSKRLITITRSKSGKVRYIPINDTVCDALKGIDLPHTGAVFRFRGKPITSNIRRAWEGAVKRVGTPRLRFHDLRHMFATRLVLAGVDLVTVKELMGHASITTTMRYAHPTPESKRNAVALLGRNALDAEALLA